MRKFHKYLGLILLLPFIAWTITGVFFFIKPGFKQAYQSLAIETYPIQAAIEIAPKPSWQEIRWLKSILGLHLLVRENDQWNQIDPTSNNTIGPPNETQFRILVNDAIQENKERYGGVTKIKNLEAITDTGITIKLDWSQLRFSQKGRDTKFINTMYQIHYLQWTGIEMVDRVLGIIGLFFILILALIGLYMSFAKPRSIPDR